MLQEKGKGQIDMATMEKVQRLERQLDETRKSYQREMLLNKSLSTYNDELNRQNEELEVPLMANVESNSNPGVVEHALLGQAAEAEQAILLPAAILHLE